MIAAWEESGDLETLISLAIQLNNQLRERHRQRDSECSVRSSGSSSWRSGATVESPTPVPAPPQEDVAGEPVQLGTNLTPTPSSNLMH